MAVIATNNQTATVQGQGAALTATVNLNGALMDMLSSVYKFMLLAAVREDIQNACDAARRAGLSFAEGVMVRLPTFDNLVLTVVDKGTGMTRDFMESTYLSFGSSTKAGDNGSLGGLGIGRFGKVGYIGEGTIKTCHASDMVERTYFMYKAAGVPATQLASEVPGSVMGTTTSVPIKETDLDECLMAIAWLKEVMQLTMRDSFSVDMPERLPQVLPEFSGTAFDLGDEDPGLKGVKLYPMKAEELQYGRQGLQSGSLVVLTNQEAGVGGLPFHVQTPSDWQSVFGKGMIVEIPMSFNLPFMPSREELKYSDEVKQLLHRIDDAAAKAIVKKVQELYDTPGLAAKATLSNLVGNDEYWHWFAHGTRHAGKISEPLRKITGGSPWKGLLKIPALPELRVTGLQVKFTSAKTPVLRETFPDGGHLAVAFGMTYIPVTFKANKPFTLVVNDLKTGGTQRFRAWLAKQGEGEFLYLTAKDALTARAAMDAVNAAFGGDLAVMLTSSFPDVTRVVVGSKVVKARSSGSSLAFYDVQQEKQATEVMGFDTFKAGESRIWVGKDGGQLLGFRPGTALSDLLNRWNPDIVNVLKGLSVSRLYLLTPKQAENLAKAQAEAQEEGLWDALPDEFGEDEDGEAAYNATTALKSWESLESALNRLASSGPVLDVLEGRRVVSVTEDWGFTSFCEELAEKPRLMLTGTRFDKAIAPYLDVMSGIVSLQSQQEIHADALHGTCKGLALVGMHLDVSEDSPEERKALAATLERLKEVGHVDYKKVWKDLHEQFPLLQAAERLHAVSDEGVEHLCHALAAVYR